MYEGKICEGKIYEGKIISDDPNPDLEALNRKGIQKLYQLTDSLDAKSEPELIKTCIESIAKLNASLRNNDVFTPKETEEEKMAKEKTALVGDLLKKG